MNKKLPWKTEPTTSSNLVEIGHPDYGVLLIEKKGSLTPNEEIEVSDYFLNVGDSESLSQAKIEIATQLLRSRVDSQWRKEDTLSQINSFSLIEDLYEFHTNERSRWVGRNYLLRCEGKQGYIAASDYAQKYGCLVANRPDIKGSWFVFAKQDDVPQGFDILADFSQPVDDSPKKHPEKLTGALSTGDSEKPTQQKKDSTPTILAIKQSG